MTAERQAAIRELMRAAERVLSLCTDEAIEARPQLPAEICQFARPGGRILLTIDLARTNATITAEMTRPVDGGGVEGLVIFELAAGPSDAFDKVLH